MIVTDVKWIDQYGRVRVGYYMNSWLAANLEGIPLYLKKSWDVVGIISGHGKVRIGKAEPMGSKVLMKDGSWKKIEDIKVEEEVISPSTDGRKNSFGKVINKVNHNNLKMCEVRRARDNKLLYTCCEDHNVPVKTLWIKKGGGKKSYPWKEEIYAAGELADKNETWYGNHCAKTITSPVIESFDVSDCKINPYLMGLYIGDGNVSSLKRVTITNPCKEIKRWLYKTVHNIREYGSPQCPQIRFDNDTLGLACGNGSNNKKIPQEALISSRGYRIKLFEGLLDTDSYINKDGYVIYTTKSEQLAKDVEVLVKTLGCRVSIKEIYKSCQTFKEKRRYYNVHINLGPLSRELRLLREEKAKILLNLDLSNVTNRESQYEPIRVVRIDKQMEGYCIEVDSKSHLYITDNYTVTHNSTMAMQTGYYIAWTLAGGKMQLDEETRKYFVSKAPTAPVRFTLENIVFSPQDLMKKARELYNKYGKHQIILYDEGRAGLDSARAMEAINKVMQDFFQECGFYGHVILIVLPNFFKLHEDYAVARSLFLIDTFADQQLRRGYFNFYNERQKEYLYFNGKKKIGTSLKYYGSTKSFTGKFGQFLPVDKTTYEKLKAMAINKKEGSAQEKRWKQQRDASFYLLHKYIDWSNERIAEEMSVITHDKIGIDGVRWAIASITKKEDINQ